MKLFETLLEDEGGYCKYEDLEKSMEEYQSIISKSKKSGIKNEEEEEVGEKNKKQERDIKKINLLEENLKDAEKLNFDLNEELNKMKGDNLVMESELKKISSLENKLREKENNIHQYSQKINDLQDVISKMQNHSQEQQFKIKQMSGNFFFFFFFFFLL